MRRDGSMTVCCLWFTVSLCGLWSVVSEAAAAETDALQRGKIIFERNCAGCHGRTGKGDGYKLLGPDPANLTAPATAEKADEDLLKTIHEGKPNMPAWDPQLSKAKIHDVLEYVRSLSR